ncbi:MAG: 4-hydroxy-tetrahydrodipicolinate synthase [Clostridia bacterium]|nr:4-hydroxy-tetrahydrodipicolinate synthase [Clostridia bacterium]
MSEKKCLFRGAATALITPFDEKGQVDADAFRRLVSLQYQSGISALVVAGTTGEASTLSLAEKELLLQIAKDEVKGNIPIIMGAGANDTKNALFLSQNAEKNGADALLLVTPYYNKGTKEGIRRHYEEIAARVHIPILLYNVPSRTGVSLSLADYARLFKQENIIGVKEAEDNMEKEAWLSYSFGKSASLYTGNDTHLLPFLSLGGDGIISVISNLYPKQIEDICRLFSSGKAERAREIFFALLPLMKLLFEETNPSPVKYAMSLLGFGAPYLRLPLFLPEEPLQKKIKAALSCISF